MESLGVSGVTWSQWSHMESLEVTWSQWSQWSHGVMESAVSPLTLLHIDVIGWKLSTRNLGSGNIISKRASLDVFPVKKSFLFATSLYTFRHRQQFRDRSIDQVIWV